MTDLISKLADDILAMINAQPRSPTKEEIVGVLAPLRATATMLLDADLLGSYPGFIPVKKDAPPPKTVWDFAKNPVLLSVNDCQGEPMIIEAVPGRPMAGYVTLTTKAEPSSTLADAIAAAKPGDVVYWPTTQEDLVKAADEVCASYEDDPAWAAEKAEFGAQVARERAGRRCPAHTDGQHNWQFNPKTQICNCACGAVGDELSDLM